MVLEKDGKCVCVFYFRTTWDLFKTFFLIKIFYIIFVCKILLALWP